MTDKSDTAGLPSDDSVAKVWDILVAGGWRPPVAPSSAISEAIAALSRASEAVAFVTSADVERLFTTLDGE